MSEQTSERLYRLLPAVYRLRDAAQGEPLRALLDLIEAELERLEGDMDQLYDDWFIETCEEWVVPYIGDLLGVPGLHPLDVAGFSLRSYVANTLRYRRRKGTASVLEQLAHDVTGWPAHVVEFFRLLATAGQMNYPRTNACFASRNRPFGLGSADLRDPVALDRLNGPFDSFAHSVDVRTISQSQGWHNIRNLGLFLWRLKPYYLNGVTPRPSVGHSYGYHFSPLGNPAPLFNRPPTGEHATAQDEATAPGPISPLAFKRDLDEYGGLAEPPDNSLYYGPARGLNIVKDGIRVPPISIVSRDLSKWERPPAAVVWQGLLSGPLDPFPSLSQIIPPSVTVKIGQDESVIKLDKTPSRVQGAATLLQAAIRSARTNQAFAQAFVLATNDCRLLVLPGILDEPVKFAAAPGDAKTVEQLQLRTTPPKPLAESVQQCILSTDLTDFPELNATPPTVKVKIGDTGPCEAVFSEVPTKLSDARSRLEDAIHATDSSLAFKEARVVIVNNRLLVLPGQLDASITIQTTEADPSTAVLLGLVNQVAVDVRLGRFAFAIGDEPEKVSVAYTYGFSGDIGGGPYDRKSSLAENEEAIRDASSQAQEPYQIPVTVTGGGPTLWEEITTWKAAGCPLRVLEIRDSKAYNIGSDQDDPNIDFPSGGWLVIQAGDGCRPILQSPSEPSSPLLALRGAGTCILDGLLIEGGLHIGGSIDLWIKHCTLVPGGALDEHGQPTTPHSASLQAVEPSENLAVTIAHSITGPLHLPKNSYLTIQDSIVQAFPGEKKAPPVAIADMKDKDYGPSLTLQRTTILGSVKVSELILASDAIFVGDVTVEKTNQGCVRSSYLPCKPDGGYQTPPRYRCQPELAVSLRPEDKQQIEARVKPVFTSQRYGDPGYVQLSLACPAEIRTGAEDGSEMGAFCSLKQPQREANLRAVLDEYLPVGLEAGLVYVT